jgi:hypothetical protein
MYDLRDSGTTVLFVSHSIGMVNRFCTDAVLLHKGHMISKGTPEEVVGQYRDILEKSQNRKDASNAERDRQLDYTITHEDEDDMPDPPKGQRRPTGEAEILDVILLNEWRQPEDRVPAGSNLTVRVRARYAQYVARSAFGAVLRDRSGTLLFATSTDMEEYSLGAREEDEVVTVDLAFGVPFRPGEYGIEATVSGEAGRLLARAEEAATFEVVAEEDAARVEIHDREDLGQAT